MLERLNPALRILCLALGLLVAYQLARLITRKDPLADFRSGPWDKLKAVPSQERASVADAPGPTLQSSNPPTLTNGPMLTNGPTLANGSTPTNAPTLSRSNAPTLLRPSTLPGSPAPPPPADLPAAIQTRVERITQSEILGAIVRPLPMALLGIAGQDAFLRAPNGQTGLLREGGELGGIKLLRIGTNRVLIEHEQQQKELMLFSGFGSETLLPKGKTK